MDQLAKERDWQQLLYERQRQQRQADQDTYYDMMKKMEAMQAEAQRRPRILEGSNAWIDESGLWIEATDGTRIHILSGVIRRLTALITMLELSKVVPADAESGV